MTDVLYVVGSQKSGDELKWSLRSLATNAKGVGHVVVVGAVPDYINKRTVKCLDVPDISAGNKHINILNCILTACEFGLVHGDFQYSSDDHYLIKPTHLSRMPFWVKTGHLKSVAEVQTFDHRATMYEAGLAATKIVLDSLNLRTDLFCCHRNTWMSTDDVPRVREIIKAQSPHDAENYGLEPTCAFMAARFERDPETPLTLVTDRKLYDFDERIIDDADWISSGDGMSDKLWDWLSNRFSKKCKYEV